MPIYHCRIAHPKTPAVGRQEYLERQGKQAYREDKLHSESANLPSWAKDAHDFWNTCQQYEKGIKYTEIEFALPNEVTPQEAIEMARKICREELQGHAYTMAVHENIGRISGIPNRHCHVMYTEREADPARPEPTRENYFKKSRTRKDGTISGGYKKAWKMSKDMTHAWYNGFRQHVETSINQAMERMGRPERVSCKSYAEQGKDIVPQIHVGAKSVAMKGERYQQNEAIKLGRAIIAENTRDAIALRNVAERYRKFNLAEALDKGLGKMGTPAMVEEKRRLDEVEQAEAEIAAVMQGTEMHALVTHTEAPRLPKRPRRIAVMRNTSRDRGHSR